MFLVNLNCYNVIILLNGIGVVANKKSDWIDDLIEEIQRHIESRNFRLSRHAMDQRRDRDLSLPDVIHVLLNGRHEKEKTLFNTACQQWNYAIRGSTLSGIEARIIVGFEGDMVVITIIRLTKKAKRKI